MAITNINMNYEQNEDSSYRQSLRTARNKTTGRKLSVFLLTILGLSLQMTNINAQTSPRITTTFDGVTSDKYISYMQLDGTNGVSLQMGDTPQLNSNMDYTAMLWFKPTTTQWSSLFSYAFQIAGSFQCYFEQSATLTCESQQRSEKLQVDVSSLRVNQWAHMTVGGSPSLGTSYLLLENNTNTIALTQKNSYVIMQQTAWGWKSCIGLCQSSTSGFVGGMRDFIFMQQYVSVAQAIRTKNHYLQWDMNILAYFRFSDKQFNKDEFRGQYATFQYGNNTNVQNKDYKPNDICFPVNDYEGFLTITSDNVINSLTVDGRWTPAQKNYGYTMSIWIKSDPSGCYQANPTTAVNSCNLINVGGVFMMHMVNTNYAKFYFFALQSYYTSSSNAFFIPHNQWINIQLAMDQYGGFEFRTYDILGRLIESQKLQTNLQQQLPTGQITILKNFRGAVRQFIFYKTRKSLPVQISQNSGTVNDNDLLFFLKFQPQYTSGTAMQNYASVSGYGAINMYTSSYPNFAKTLFYDFPQNGAAKIGLTSFNSNLFDGLACNDDYMTLQLIDKTSYVKAVLPSIDIWLQSATVEFWLRPSSAIKNSTQIFSMWGKSAQSEFFTISTDAVTSQLNCAPFGITSVRSPSVAIQGYNETTRQKYGWMHVSCQYTYMRNITTSLHAQLSAFSSNPASSAPLDTNQTLSLAAIPSYIPADIYTVYMGNSYQMKTGPGLLQMKEVRMWGTSRTPDEIALWRYRQVKSQQFVFPQLALYVRMAEASYDEFNLENVVGNSATFSNIQYVSDPTITICPQQSYYVAGQCYQDPVNQLVPAIFPDYDAASGRFNWRITASSTELIDQKYLGSLLVSWAITDNVVRSVASTQAQGYDMSVPSSAFAENSIYQMTLNLTNYDLTFNQLRTINFVPVSCRFFVVADSGDAYSTYRLYKQPQAVSDISFQMLLTERTPFCSNVTFYNKLVQRLTYVISPAVSGSMPVLNYTFGADNKTINVVIPAAEQPKFTIGLDYKIIFSIRWTSSLYEGLISPNPATSDFYTFQNVRYTINFNSNGITVAPLLTVSSKYATTGMAIHLDASGSVLQGVLEGHERDNLTYSWICPTTAAGANLQNSLCSSQQSSTLDISYSDFVSATNSSSFGEVLTFKVNVTWSKSATNQQSFLASQDISWYNTPDPSFSVARPDTILSTKGNNTFKVAFDNYQVSNVNESLTVKWSLQPALLNASLGNFTDNNTTLVLLLGALIPGTNYTFSVTATSILYPVVTLTKTVAFTTGSPPTGGSAYITPDAGFLNSTEFTVGIQDWKSVSSSSSGNVMFRVWSTQLLLSGPIPDQLLSTNYLNQNDTFKLIAQNVNPLIVEISDSVSGEVVYKIVHATVTVSPSSQTGATPEELLGQLDQYQDQPSLKYSYINTIVKMIQSNTSGSDSGPQPTPDQSTINEQVALRESLIGTVESDISNTSASTSDSQLAMSSSVSVLSKLLTNTYYVTDEIAQRSLNVVGTLVSKTDQFSNLLATNSLYGTQFTSTLSSLFLYGSSKVSSLATTFRRLLQSSSSTLDNSGQNQTSNISNASNSSTVNSTGSISNMTGPSTANESSDGFVLTVHTDTLQGIQDLSDETAALKNKFMNQLCQDLKTQETQLAYSSPAMNLIVEQIPITSQLNNEVFINPLDQTSGLSINVQSMIQAVNRVPSINPSSICVQTTFYQINPAPIDVVATQKTLYQHSAVIFEQTLTDQTGQRSLQHSLDQLAFTSMYFNIDPSTYKNNQTVCMAYSDSLLQWSAESCLTKLDTTTYQIKCACTMTDNQYYGVFTDTNRMLDLDEIPQPNPDPVDPTPDPTDPVVTPTPNPSDPVSTNPTPTDPTNNTTTNPKPVVTSSNTENQGGVSDGGNMVKPASQSFSFIGVIIIMIALGAGLPVASLLLDRKDYKHATAKLESSAKRNFLEKVAMVSQEPLAWWKFKQDQAFTYSNMTSKTLVSHYITQIHPLVSIFTKYDVTESRLLRASIYSVQLSLYALICVTAFGKQYRKDATMRNEYGLDDKDAGNIIIVGLIGMVLLLPTPAIAISFFKSKVIKDKNSNTLNPQQQTQNQDQHSRSGNFDNIDNTQEQNILDPLPSSIIGSRNQNARAKQYSSTSAMNRRTSQFNIHQEITIVPQRQKIQYGILGFGYVLWVIAFATVIAFSFKGSIFNSYCVVASYYFGIFGSIFCSNMIRIGLNILLAQKVFENEKSILRFIVAEEAVQILKDIEIVKTSEKLVQQHQDESQAPLQNNYLVSEKDENDGGNNGDQPEEEQKEESKSQKYIQKETRQQKDDVKSYQSPQQKKTRQKLQQQQIMQRQQVQQDSEKQLVYKQQQQQQVQDQEEKQQQQRPAKVIMQISPKVNKEKTTPKDKRLYTSNDISAISLGDMPIIIQKQSTNNAELQINDSSFNDRKEDSESEDGGESVISSHTKKQPHEQISESQREQPQFSKTSSVDIKLHQSSSSSIVQKDEIAKQASPMSKTQKVSVVLSDGDEEEEEYDEEEY